MFLGLLVAQLLQPPKNLFTSGRGGLLIRILITSGFYDALLMLPLLELQLWLEITKKLNY